MNKQQGAVLRARRERAREESVEQGSWTFELPFPPSANEYWRSRAVRLPGGKLGVQVYVSPAARQFKERAAQTAREFGVRPLSGPVALSLALWLPSRACDISNSCKVLEDALNTVAYVDDAQVERIQITRLGIDSKNPRAIVTVCNNAPLEVSADSPAELIFDVIGPNLQRLLEAARARGYRGICHKENRFWFTLKPGKMGDYDAAGTLESEFALSILAEALVRGFRFDWLLNDEPDPDPDFEEEIYE